MPRSAGGRSMSALSRRLSRILRHEPWAWELELDDEGWAPVESVLAGLRAADPAWIHIERTDLERMIERSDKRRHELVGDRIRALYGHSLPGRLTREPGTPPERLFHGTSPEAWAAISANGLRPMSRQYVHLSVDLATAEQVGRRKSRRPVVLTVRAGAAHRAGVPFSVGNEAVWLAGSIPPHFLAVERTGGSSGGDDTG